jgi:selenium metabolism protein YedF
MTGGNSTAINKKVLLLTADVLGQGDEALGKLLMKNYLFAVTEDAAYKKPEVVLLINRGVLLAVEGAPTSQQLAQLAAGGTAILACGTCLDYYQVKDKLAAGEASNIYTIRDYLTGEHQVITL